MTALAPALIAGFAVASYSSVFLVHRRRRWRWQWMPWLALLWACVISFVLMMPWLSRISFDDECSPTGPSAVGIALSVLSRIFFACLPVVGLLLAASWVKSRGDAAVARGYRGCVLGSAVVLLLATGPRVLLMTLELLGWGMYH